MKFHFEHLGPITKADIELGELTLLCGENNTGKTYVSYAIYGFLKTWREQIDFNLEEDYITPLLENGFLKIDLGPFRERLPDVLKKCSERYVKHLSRIFSADEDQFSDILFEASLTHSFSLYQKEFHSVLRAQEREILKIFKPENENFLDISLWVDDKKTIPPARMIQEFIQQGLGITLLGNYVSPPFIITAERTGISLFHRELDISKNVFVERLQEFREQGKKSKLGIIDWFEMMEESMSRYVFPVKKEIDFVRDIVDVHSKKKSPIIKEHPHLTKLLKEIVGGEYKVRDEQIVFSFKQGRKNHVVPLYLGSSTVKSLLDIYFYIHCLAKPGDILLMDEPELNLHPKNQRKMARLFVQLIRAGVKVFVTTHSDYLIKELNNLIILGNDFEDREKIMKKYRYTEEDVLDRSKVKAYIAEENTLVSASIDESGIEVKNFDKEIDNMNEFYDDVLFAKVE